MRSVSQIIPAPQITDFEHDPKFQQSALKLYWAHRHAFNLTGNWEIHVTKHFNAAMGGNQDLGYPIEEYLIHPPVPVDFALQLGDCIRNMRSALDYLVSEMARAADLSDQQTIFPFAENLAGLKSSFNEPVAGDKHRKGRRAGSLYELAGKYPNLEKVILTDIQPYNGDNGAHPFGDLLWRVITSDNVDKHRLMSPTVQHTRAANVRFQGLTGGIFGGVTMIGPVLRHPEGTRLDPKSDISVDVVFKEPARLAGKPIASTLIQGLDAVREVIKIFRREIELPVAKSA